MATQSTTAHLMPDTTRPNGREHSSAPDALDSSTAGPHTKEDPPLRSVHTSNFSALLQELGISVLVTTYQAGKLIPKVIKTRRPQDEANATPWSAEEKNTWLRKLPPPA